MTGAHPYRPLPATNRLKIEVAAKSWTRPPKRTPIRQVDNGFCCRRRLRFFRRYLHYAYAYSS